MNPGIAQGRTQTIQLPRRGRLMAPIFAGSGPYGGHDPYLNGANPYANGASQAGALGVGGGVGGGGGVFMPGGGVAGLAASYQGAYGDYRDEVAAQDQTLRTGFADRYKRGMAEVDKLGGAAVADTNRIYDEQAGEVKAQLAKAGLLQGGGTVVSDPLMGVARERSTSLARTLDTIAQRRIAVDAQLSGDQLDQIERVTHTPPDMNQLAGLASQAGSGNMEGMQPGNQMPGGYPMPPQDNGFGGPVAPPLYVDQKAANRAASYIKTRQRKAAARAPAAVPPVGGMAPAGWPARQVAALPRPVMPTVPAPNFSSVRTLSTPKRRFATSLVGG